MTSQDSGLDNETVSGGTPDDASPEPYAIVYTREDGDPNWTIEGRCYSQEEVRKAVQALQDEGYSKYEIRVQYLGDD